MFKLETLIGRPFFYADYETGIGWESKIDEVTRSWDSDSVFLELSCGTRVKINGKDYLMNNYKVFTTNLKEDNG